VTARIELRPVPEPAPAPGPLVEEGRRSYGRTAIVLAIALALSVLGWILNAFQHGREVRSLEAEIETLESQITSKDAALAAQQQRLTEVRDQVQSVLELLDQPLSHGR